MAGTNCSVDDGECRIQKVNDAVFLRHFTYLEEFHDSKVRGHAGTTKTIARILISVLGFVEPLCCGFENLACWHRARTFTSGVIECCCCWHRARTFTGGVIECCCYWHRARTFTGIESLSSFVKHSEEVFILCEDSEEVFIPCGLQGNVNSRLRLTTGCRISVI
ncbi:hypothetical protein V8G54_012691 [Vigna mungo]|uniref:Uncharacterized protein n=1 Tax=Vigna mungo TaxID=3915 RepID=A0AAQ3NSQ8_VIGMU